MNASTIKYQVLKPDTHLDCAEFSLCPSCSSNIIRLADDGMRDTSRIPCCSLCGWSEQDILQGGLSNCSSNSSDTLENKLSIPCLIKQPKRAETKGIIQKDLGGAAALASRDRFSVYISSNGTTVNVSKLLVYPDFSNIGDKLLQGGKGKSSSNCSSTLDNCSLHSDTDVKVLKDTATHLSDTSGKCSSKTGNPPCTKTDKTRRHKGEGSGHIYYRTVTRNGKNYQQAYYQWRTEGKQRTKYIPKKLLKYIEEAEEQKLPVTKILELLQGGLNKCSSNCSITSTKVRSKSESDEINPNCSSKNYSPPCKDLENEEDSKNRGCSKSLDVLAIDESVGIISNNCSSNSSNPPCNKKKRSAGCGGGYVEYREVKRNYKVYAQYWYHYEFWSEGVASHSPRRDRIGKGSKYIPKRLVQKIERMNREKLAVKGILEVLKNKRKK